MRKMRDRAFPWTCSSLCPRKKTIEKAARQPQTQRIRPGNEAPDKLVEPKYMRQIEGEKRPA